MHNFKVLCATLGEFQAFITDLRSITKHGNSIKPNLSMHNTKVVLSLAPYKKRMKTTMASYIVKVNAKSYVTYGDLLVPYSRKVNGFSLVNH